MRGLPSPGHQHPTQKHHRLSNHRLYAYGAPVRSSEDEVQYEREDFNILVLATKKKKKLSLSTGLVQRTQ